MARKKKKKSTEDLSTENELMKLKLMAEFGGDFVGGEEIPPDVENQFLKQIVQFHKQHDKSAITTVYKFIGEPEYNHVRDLTDKELRKELKRLMRIMEKNGVGLSVLAETPQREVYRFITEELFKHEIEDVKLKGWTNQFIYEEFYPNADYDVRNAVGICLNFLFNKNNPFPESYFAEEMKNSIGLSMDAGELEEKVKKFHEEFANVKLKDFQVTKITVDKEANTAHVVCQVNYSTQTEKRKKYKPETTEVEIYLATDKDMDSWWQVNRVVSSLF